jgi:iron complex outermembrane receptor protein
MSSNLSIRQAVGLAVGAAGATVGYIPLASALDAAATGPADTSATNTTTELQEVVVTGSRIRRVDVETANVIVNISEKDIQATGLTTVGDVLQRLPSVSGGVGSTTPNVNNGGGFGDSTVELRGLNASRTVVLVDGRRIGNPNFNSNGVDVNQIPVNLIDHIEVLKEGAGAIYGADAIAGVINFITRSNVEGVEIGGNYGQTTHDDGNQYSGNIIFGHQTENFHFVAGGTWYNQQAVYAAGRDYSKYALYLYNGSSQKGGSSRTPTGRIFAPQAAALGCGNSVTRIGPANGMGGALGTSLADYRCFGFAADHYNYQPLNLLTTPVERAQGFFKTDYEINDHADVYGNFTYNHTHSAAIEAALPFDSQVDDITISKNSIYNPFGTDFGGLSGVNPDAEWRTSALGQRTPVADVSTEVMNLGTKGKLGLADWEYDANVGYSRLDYTQQNNGYYVHTKLQNAVGPSYWANAAGAVVPAGTAGAIPTCGTVTAGVGTPIENCTPLNIFNMFAPGQAPVVAGVATNVTNNDSYTYKAAQLDFNGTVFQLPAGAAKAAVGFFDESQEGNFQPSPLALAAPPLFLACGVSNEQCTAPTRGHYSSREGYFEAFVPILKDMPGVESLNFDGGVRYASYSLFGNTTKGEGKLEYKPIKDLLIRGTFAQVFRIPTIHDLYQGPQNTSVTFNDPCNGLTAAKVAATPNLALACQGVPLTGNYHEPNGQITGLNSGNPNVQPESGTVKTAGFVYEPHWVSGLSFEATYWQYNLNGVIAQLDSNYSIAQCIATGSSAYCNLIHRYLTGPSAGNILVSEQPTSNLSTLVTDGVDFAMRYNLRNTPIGTFNFTASVTDTMSYKNTPNGGSAVQYAGTYNKQFGNYAKLRGIASAQWANWGWEGTVWAQYIDSLTVLHADALTGAPLAIGSTTYWNMSAAYNFAKTNTHVQLSIINAFDKQPPIFYQNNVTNANTDVSTYDTLGRRWSLSLLQKF